MDGPSVSRVYAAQIKFPSNAPLMQLMRHSTLAQAFAVPAIAGTDASASRHAATTKRNLVISSPLQIIEPAYS